VRHGAQSTSRIRALGLVVTAIAMHGCTSLYGIVTTPSLSADADGDGWATPLDCDDSDPDINPGVEETTGDDVDVNCDGSIDPQA